MMRAMGQSQIIINIFSISFSNVIVERCRASMCGIFVCNLFLERLLSLSKAVVVVEPYECPTTFGPLACCIYVISYHISHIAVRVKQQEWEIQLLISDRIWYRDATAWCARVTVWRCKYFQPEFYYRKCSTEIAWRTNTKTIRRKFVKESERERVSKPFTSTQDVFIKLISRIKWSLIIYICLKFTLCFWGVCAFVCMCLCSYVYVIRQFGRADCSIPKKTTFYYSIELNKFLFVLISCCVCVCLRFITTSFLHDIWIWLCVWFL